MAIDNNSQHSGDAQELPPLLQNHQHINFAATDPMRPALAGKIDLPLRWLDALFNRIYSSQYNPLYQSGPLAILAMLATVASGLYLLFFYKVADPYGSITRIVDSIWLGNFARSLHRYSGDLAVVATLVHGLRMFLQGRTWGPRALAWTSGVLLLAALLLCGWTGFIMVWDVQGQLAAQQVAHLMDALPLFSEPISRAFLDAARPPESFFFINLFLHVALPVAIVALLIVHLLRIANPRLLPPKAISWHALLCLVVFSALAPAPMLAEADMLRLPGVVPIDFLYGFWLPIADHLPAWAVYLTCLLFFAPALTAPLWWRPAKKGRPPSEVHQEYCTGCEQCYNDCPFEAISMIDRPNPGKLSARMAWVDPTLCVSCGLCAPSCAPMCIGPPGRNGRDEIHRIQSVIDGVTRRENALLVLACRNGLGKNRGLEVDPDTVVAEIDCVGSLHTSVIEFALRRNIAGVAVVTCPERDCQYRGGPIWLKERVFNGREAELKARVDKTRLRVLSYAASESRLAILDLQSFRADLQQRPPRQHSDLL